MTAPARPGAPLGEVPPGRPTADPAFEALVRRALQAAWNGNPAPGAWTRLAARLTRSPADTATGVDNPATSSSPD
jgi:hypothetical protein